MRKLRTQYGKLTRNTVQFLIQMLTEYNFFINIFIEHDSTTLQAIEPNVGVGCLTGRQTQGWRKQGQLLPLPKKPMPLFIYNKQLAQGINLGLGFVQVDTSEAIDETCQNEPFLYNTFRPYTLRSCGLADRAPRDKTFQINHSLSVGHGKGLNGVPEPSQNYQAC